jgi:hypothetical protein
LNDTKRTRIVFGTGDDLPARMTYGADKEGVHAQKRRLALRASYGKDWDGTADNDNINWPLAKALLAEGNGDLLKYAMMYRKTYEMAKGEVLIGMKGQPSAEMTIVHRSYMDESTGRITYGGEIVRKGASSDIQPTRSTPTNPDSKKNAAPVPRPWTGDRAINDAIDAREKLAWLQSLLGPTLEPFEMACIDGATLAEVGAASGASSRDGKPGAGRAICHLALITIRDALGPISRQDIAA